MLPNGVYMVRWGFYPSEASGLFPSPSFESVLFALLNRFKTWAMADLNMRFHHPPKPLCAIYSVVPCLFVLPQDYDFVISIFVVASFNNITTRYSFHQINYQTAVFSIYFDFVS
ncbi:hypothetical protein PEPS_37420 (plasmid) [Persicobacter psychrovividus]|uniref:Uncharacterized protein n=1 Tax=Persicobacter psychrovividus TaxID=387638 RepID=A0ABN6LEH7_9BACT|nr:hypothetical protein PEPS_37420 [Persicobacter psychrovividus]